MLIGVDEKHPLNSAGGAATHTISQEELPPRIHDLPARVNGDNKQLDLRMNEGNTARESSMEPYVAVYIWRRTA